MPPIEDILVAAAGVSVVASVLWDCISTQRKLRAVRREYDSLLVENFNMKMRAAALEIEYEELKGTTNGT